MNKETNNMSQKIQEDPAGNTKTAGSNNQIYRWCATLPIEEVEASQLSQHLKGFCKKFTFQGEKSESGYLHWQIEFTLKEKLRFNQVKNILGFNKIHLEPTKNYFKAKNYCMKTESRIEGPYNEESTFIKTITNLYPWQKNLLSELLLEPDDRKIVWYVDKEGGKGKTQFCKYMAIKHKAFVFNNGKFADIAYAMKEDCKIVLFNFSRTQEDHINYNAIEALKDGLIFSGKYESNMKIFNSPHIVIFANFEPDLKSMSLDRWDIREL